MEKLNLKGMIESVIEDISNDASISAFIFKVQLIGYNGSICTTLKRSSYLVPKKGVASMSFFLHTLPGVSFDLLFVG